uniref:Uncharacterized protein n=1 Tax=Glossina brevipalpis TaxID=37001 RepID=A0A1A9VZW5_9MUSC
MYLHIIVNEALCIIINDLPPTVIGNAGEELTGGPDCRVRHYWEYRGVALGGGSGASVPAQIPRCAGKHTELFGAVIQQKFWT